MTKTVRMLGQRLLEYIPTLIIAVLIIFFLQRLIPGDVAAYLAGDSATAERIEAIREDLGLNEPLFIQFFSWIAGAFTGDFGVSLLNGQEVSVLLGQRLPTTLQLTIMALIIAVAIGVPTAVFASTRRGGWLDDLMTTISTFGISMPAFWLGMMLVMVFALQLGWFPATGAVPFTQDPLESIRSLFLPSFALGIVGAAEISRQLRSAMFETLDADFVRTHRAKGLSQGSVVWKHSLKNASIPLLTVVGMQVNRFLGGAVVIELVFGLPGIGSLIVDSTNQRDYPVVQAIVFVTAILVLTTNLLVDILYRVLDPRIS